MSLATRTDPDSVNAAGPGPAPDLAVALEVVQDNFALKVDFTAPMPGVVALFGASGAGKTTVLHCLAGLVRPRTGHARVGDAPIFDLAAGRWPAPEARGIGMVFQDARLFPHLSVTENLRYGERRRRDRPLLVGFGTVVDLLGLGPLLSRRPATLSGGERQRVAIGRALLSQPRLLILDEPLAALDGPRKAEVLPFLADLRARLAVPILYVSHALDEVMQLADTLVVLDQGRQVAVGPVGALMTRLDLPILAHRADAASVIDATLVARDPANGLDRLAFPGGELVTASIGPGTTGACRRARIAARDVLLATQRPAGLSAHNVLEARISTIVPDTGGQQALVGLMVGETPLLSRVMTETVGRLGLVPGAPVFAIVKSVVVER